MWVVLGLDYLYEMEPGMPKQWVKDIQDTLKNVVGNEGVGTSLGAVPKCFFPDDCVRESVSYTHVSE